MGLPGNRQYGSTREVVDIGSCKLFKFKLMTKKVIKISWRLKYELEQLIERKTV